jgi:TM2 domain-containing membrane protein YozV
MGEMITKPDANPIVLAVANLFCLGGAGYFLAGQQGKAIAAFIYTMIAWAITFGTLGWILALVFAYDAYLLGQKLASGESIGEKENGLEFLNNLPGFK